MAQIRASSAFGVGIVAGTITSATIDNNVISGFSTGLSTRGVNPVKCRNNIVSGAATAYAGGINIGGND